MARCHNCRGLGYVFVHGSGEGRSNSTKLSCGVCGGSGWRPGAFSGIGDHLKNWFWTGPLLFSTFIVVAPIIWRHFHKNEVEKLPVNSVPSGWIKTKDGLVRQPLRQGASPATNDSSSVAGNTNAEVRETSGSAFAESEAKERVAAETPGTNRQIADESRLVFPCDASGNYCVYCRITLSADEHSTLTFPATDERIPIRISRTGVSCPHSGIEIIEQGVPSGHTLMSPDGTTELYCFHRTGRVTRPFDFDWLAVPWELEVYSPGSRIFACRGMKPASRASGQPPEASPLTMSSTAGGTMVMDVTIIPYVPGNGLVVRIFGALLVLIGMLGVVIGTGMVATKGSGAREQRSVGATWLCIGLSALAMHIFFLVHVQFLESVDWRGAISAFGAFLLVVIEWIIIFSAIATYMYYPENGSRNSAWDRFLFSRDSRLPAKAVRLSFHVIAFSLAATVVSRVFPVSASLLALLVAMSIFLAVYSLMVLVSHVIAVDGTKGEVDTEFGVAYGLLVIWCCSVSIWYFESARNTVLGGVISGLLMSLCIGACFARFRVLLYRDPSWKTRIYQIFMGLFLAILGAMAYSVPVYFTNTLRSESGWFLGTLGSAILSLCLLLCLFATQNRRAHT